MEKVRQWIGKLWNLIGGDAVWDALRNWGWPSMMTILLTVWGWVRDIPGPYLVQICLATFAIMLFISREWRERHQSTQSSPIANNRLPETHTWLMEIAERDLRSETGVVVVERSAVVRAPNTPTPYIEFSWTVFNGLVWEIEIEEHPTGHISLPRSPVWGDREWREHLLEPRYKSLYFPGTVASPPTRTIPHGGSIEIRLHHWVSQADITILRERISFNGKITIHFGSFNIWMTKGHEGNKHRSCIYLWDEQFDMPELSRAYERENNNT